MPEWLGYLLQRNTTDHIGEIDQRSFRTPSNGDASSNDLNSRPYRPHWLRTQAGVRASPMSIVVRHMFERTSHPEDRSRYSFQRLAKASKVLTRPSISVAAASNSFAK
jgi:hypothetical protein